MSEPEDQDELQPVANPDAQAEADEDSPREELTSDVTLEPGADTGVDQPEQR